jgi:adenine-specific DNA methylase
LWFDPVDENCPTEFRRAAREQMRKWARDSRGLMSAESYAHFETVQKNPARLEDDQMVRTLLFDFIADFANWDNSTKREYLETSRALTGAAHLAAGGEAGTRPLVVDPFAGGGAIPLEALRVGADAFASDLNPVAVLLNKLVLEYIPRYGQQLADEVRKWGAWVKAEAEKELAEFYPKDPDGSTPIAYLWARTIKCEGVNCGAEVPLMRSLWLAKNGRRSTALRVIPDRDRKYVDFEIVQNAKPSEVGDGTVKRGGATCPVCGYSTPVASVRRQLRERRGGADDARLFCVVTLKSNQQGRFYRLPTALDHEVISNAQQELKRREKAHNGSLSLVPNEPLPPQGTLGFRVQLYGMEQWGNLFTSRQSLALTTLANFVHEAGRQLKRQHSNGLAIAVQTCLALQVDKLTDLNNALVGWDATVQCPHHLFARQAIPIVWDFAESCIVGESSGSLGVLNERFTHVMKQLGSDWAVGHPSLASAIKHPLPDDSVGAFITDPPYYDAVPYADLSDFFYVWLKRTISECHPELFQGELTPKADECIVDEVKGKDRAYFEKTMAQAMVEGRRILQPSGVGIVVFAHKSTAGWEAQLQAMVDAGWTITGSWAIDTEAGNRLRARDSAALASSVHLVIRPRENADGSVRANDIGDWRDVLRELPIRIHEWMTRLAKEGVVGADAIFACLGPALEIFSRYSRVEKASGEQVTLREYLEYVWAAVAKEALTMIFAGTTDADVTGYEPDARLTAMWLWTLSAGVTTDSDQTIAEAEEAKNDEEDASGKAMKTSGFGLEYDTARKIAQGLGANLEVLTQLVEVKGDKARLLSVAERTKHLFGKDESESPSKSAKKKDKQAKLFETLEDVEAETGGWGDKSAPELGNTVLDRVHQTMILFAAGRSDATKRFLVDEGVGNDERFWRLANALSALYPANGEEKRWVDGVLARKKGLGF